MNLLSDIFKKVFNIKTKVYGYLKNITENTIDSFDTTAKIDNNQYLYIDNDTTYTIKQHNNTIIFTRENSEMQHTMIFNLNKITTSEYYLKELHTSLEFNIKTNLLIITDQQFKINYQILETNNEYEYIIEMSDIK